VFSFLLLFSCSGIADLLDVELKEHKNEKDKAPMKFGFEVEFGEGATTKKKKTSELFFCKDEKGSLLPSFYFSVFVHLVPFLNLLFFAFFVRRERQLAQRNQRSSVFLAKRKNRNRQTKRFDSASLLSSAAAAPPYSFIFCSS
jgi:hypothetical protein